MGYDARAKKQYYFFFIVAVFATFPFDRPYRWGNYSSHLSITDKEVSTVSWQKKCGIVTPLVRKRNEQGEGFAFPLLIFSRTFFYEYEIASRDSRDRAPHVPASCTGEVDGMSRCPFPYDRSRSPGHSGRCRRRGRHRRHTRTQRVPEIERRRFRFARPLVERARLGRSEERSPVRYRRRRRLL